MAPGSIVRISYFSDTMPDALTVRLEAAVVWRVTPADGHRSGLWGRGPIAWLRRLRHGIWLRLGPLGANVEWLGARAHGRVVKSDTLRGEDALTAFHDGHAVRVLGRVYKLPLEGRSLVLLVEMGQAVRISARTLPAPVAAAPVPPRDLMSVDHTMASTDFVSKVVVGGELPEWEAALRADPEVRAFMEASTIT